MTHRYEARSNLLPVSTPSQNGNYHHESSKDYHPEGNQVCDGSQINTIVLDIIPKFDHLGVQNAGVQFEEKTSNKQNGTSKLDIIEN